MRDKTASRQPGFTLIELGIVIAIIGILVSLILIASVDGVRRAEERQTQALIIKIEAALSERVEALQATTAPINQTHRYLAAITYVDNDKIHYDPIAASIDRRAQVIAQFDYMKAELPDVFYVNIANDANYPFNFGMPPYPLTLTGATTDSYALPLGNRSPGLPYVTNPTSNYVATPGFDLLTGYNDVGVPSYPSGLLVTQDYGVHGASFAAMGALTKNLYESAATALGSPAWALPKQGYDGVDNDKDQHGYIDNINEVTYPNGTSAQAQAFQQQVISQLGNHTHNTARAEMLYALLVEGQGPLGSAFNKSDFTNRDVADTDGDGMPEFIDAWGQPLQFYRWPIFYGGSANGSSDSQQGYQPYSYQNRRQLDPLDPNQLLTSVAWWTGTFQGSVTNYYLPSLVVSGSAPTFPNSSDTNGPSPQAYAFMSYFHILIDPQTSITTPTNPQTINLWDRTGYSRRRAYYSKFLVLSGGPDKQLGVFQLGKNYQGEIDSSLSPAIAFPTGNPITDAQYLNWVESQAAQVEFNNGTVARGGTFYEQVNNANYPVSTTPTSLYLQNNAGLDDISNHALSAPGSGAK